MTFDDPIMTVFGPMRWYSSDKHCGIWYLDLIDMPSTGDYCARVDLSSTPHSAIVFPPSGDRAVRRTMFSGEDVPLQKNASIAEVLVSVVQKLLELGIVDMLWWVACCEVNSDV